MVATVRPYIIVTGGDGGYGNLGDEWLRIAAFSHYEEVVKKYRVVLMTANMPTERDERFEYIADTKEAFLKHNIRVEEIAALHYYGGGYLNTYWMDEKLWLYDLLTEQGLDTKKVFFTGLGLGPFDANALSKLHGIAKGAGIFGVRDTHYLESVGGDFMFDESIAVVEPKRARRFGRNELWINFRMASHVGAGEEETITLVKKLQRFAMLYRLTIHYFAMIDGKGFDERAEMVRVLKRCGIENPRVHARATGYGGLLNQFNKAAMIVTTSYHATLAGLYRGIPVVAVYENEYYDLKFTGIQKAFKSTPLLTLVSLQDYNASAFIDAYTSRDPGIISRVVRLKRLNSETYQSYLSAIGVDVRL